MLRNEEIEEKIRRNDQGIEEINLKIDLQNRQITDFLNELGVSPEQLSIFINDRNNFTEANWEALQAQKKALDAKLERDLANVPNLTAIKKTYKDRRVDKNWIFVR